MWSAVACYRFVVAVGFIRHIIFCAINRTATVETSFCFKKRKQAFALQSKNKFSIMSEIKVKILKNKNFPDIKLPNYQTPNSSGMDLYAATENAIILKPNEIKLIPTGIKLSIPKGYEGQIRPRSGLALKNSVGILNSPGTIDADYRGEVGVVMFNFGKEDFVISRGDRIAQIVFCKVEKAQLIEVDELDSTKRNEGGFGHTGK